jgi:hypothetical protein
MAEMTTLVAAIYKKYSTTLKAGFGDVAPGVTSRFEVFSDDSYEKIAVSICSTSYWT